MAGSERLEIILALKDAIGSGLKKVGDQLDGLGKHAKSVGDSFFNLKSAIAGIGAGAAIGDIVKTFADFDDKMRAVGAVSGATGEQMERMTALAQKMGSETRYSASNAAEGLQFLSMAGFDSEKAMQALPGVLNLAAAANMDLGTAADIATNVLSGMQLPVEELARVNDVLAKTATSANTNVMELGEAFKIAGPAAKGSGQSLEETAVILGALANNGIKGAEGGHAVKRMLIALQAPSAEAKRTFTELGISLEDAEGNFRGLTPVIQDLGRAGLDLKTADAIFGKFTATAAVAAAGAANDITRLTTAIDNAGGTTDRIAKQMEAGLGGAIRALKSAWEGLKIAIGDGFDSSVGSVISYLTEQIRSLTAKVVELKNNGQLAEWGNRISAAVKSTLEYFRQFGETVVTVAGYLSPLLKILVNMSPELIAVAAGAKTLSMGITAAQGAMVLWNQVMVASAFGQYIQKVMIMSREFGVMKLAMSSVGAAASTAAVLVGAFFAGWQIGKLLNEIPSVQAVAQLMFADLDKGITNLQIKLLEVRKAWNIATGDFAEADQMQAAIDAQKEYLNQIEATKEGIIAEYSEAQKGGQVKTDAANQAAAAAQTANAGKVQAAQTAAEQIAAIERASVDNYLTTLEQSNAAAKAGYDSRIKEIELAEAKGEISHNQAIDAKLAADTKYYQDTVGKAQAHFDKAGAYYGQDSEKHKQAMEAKIAALDAWVAREKEVADQIKGINEQIAESRMSSEEKIRALKQKTMGEYEAYQDKVKQIEEKISAAQAMAATDTEKSMQMYKEAQNMATGLSSAVEEGGKVVVSQNDAVDKAIALVQEAQKGMESAANSRKAVLQDVMQTAQEEGNKTQQAIAGINQTLAEMDIKPIALEINADNAYEEIEYVRANLDEMRENLIAVDADTSAFDQKIAAVEAKLKTLRASISEAEMTVNFKGKASPEAPLTETIDNVSKKIDGLKQNASQGATSTVNFDTSPATQAMGELEAEADATKAKISEPAPMNVDISPAKAAMQELADEAYKTAVASQKAAMQLEAGLERTSGDLHRVMEQNMRNLKEQARSAESDWKRLSNMSANVRFTGTASPTRPLTETINNVTEKLRQMRRDAEQQISMNVKMTGTGSRTMPLSEKLKSMTGEIRSFAGGIPGISLPVDFSGAEQAMNTLNSLGTAAPSAVGIQNPFGKIKDFGKTTFQTPDGGSHPVWGQTDIVRTLRDTLRRERMVSV